jgi:hypothetical protein
MPLMLSPERIVSHVAPRSMAADEAQPATIELDCKPGVFERSCLFSERLRRPKSPARSRAVEAALQ